MNQIHALIPSLRIFQVLGINPISFDKNNGPKRQSRGLKFYSLFIIGCSMLALAGSFYERDLYINKTQRNIASIVDFLQLIGIRIAHLVTVCESFIQQKMLQEFYVNLCDVDATMKKINIGETKFVENRAKNVCATTLLMTIYVGVQMTVIALLILRGDNNMIRYRGSFFFPFIVCCFRYYQVFTCVWVIRQRYKLLNKRLAEIELMDGGTKKVSREVPSLDFKLCISEVKTEKRSKPLKSFEELIILRQLYDKLYVMSTLVNYVFGLSNLVNIASDFVAVTANSYFIFISLQSSLIGVPQLLKVAQSIFSCLVQVVNVVSLTAICFFTMQTVS